MKILFIPYGTERAPATRYRVTQYLPYLKEEGVEFTVFSAISKFSTSLMIKSPDFKHLARFLYYIYVSMERIFRSFYVIALAGRFDIVFLQRTTFSFRLELLLKMANGNVIFDIDDAIFMPDKPHNDIVTRVKKHIKEREVLNVLKISKAVIVENEYIRDFASRYCGNVHKIPGPIDTERFHVRKKEEVHDVVVGWIGTPATTPYLYAIDDALRDLRRKYDFVRLRFIGAGIYKSPGIKFERVDWDYKTEVEDLQDFDIGIMPMPDNEWTRGKLGCKMLQYMAMNIPAVVSYTPTNAEIIKHGENGFFATTKDQWKETLSTLIENKTLRNAIGQKGRLTVLDKCSLSGNVKKMMNIFNSTARRNNL